MKTRCDLNQQKRQKMPLAELIIETETGDDCFVSGISSNSRKVSKGDLFAAIPGTNFHGAKFIEDALKRGAVAILTDKEGKTIANRLDFSKTKMVVVKNVRASLAEAASRWFGDEPEIGVAVTGTNGKTSVVSFCQQIWQHSGKNAASFGTLGIDGAWSARLDHTTPDPITLHYCLAESAAAGVTHVALEASSHGLEQYRMDSVNICAAAFTNLSHDHLDYHQNRKNYFNSKAGLFSRVLPKSGVAVICIESEAGKKMLEVAQCREQQTIKVGREGADLELLGQQLTRNGQYIRYRWQGQIYESVLNLMGGFQAWNFLTATGLVIASGEKPEMVFEALKTIKPVRGRLQLAGQRENGAAVYVDYAHTPDGLKASMSSLREHYNGRLIVLFGAGGDRDRSKRPVMGAMGSRYADKVIITDDNPRSENPKQIRNEILQGCSEAIEIADRAEAIVRGVDMLESGDVLLVAGKGHETGQEVAGNILPFDDVEQASIAVRALDRNPL